MVKKNGKIVHNEYIITNVFDYSEEKSIKRLWSYIEAVKRDSVDRYQYFTFTTRAEW